MPGGPPRRGDSRPAVRAARPRSTRSSAPGTPSPPQRPGWERGIRVRLKHHGTAPLSQPETRGMAPTALDSEQGGLRSHKAARCPGTTCDLPEERGPPGVPLPGSAAITGAGDTGPSHPLTASPPAVVTRRTWNARHASRAGMEAAGHNGEHDSASLHPTGLTPSAGSTRRTSVLFFLNYTS